jgi:hypothetical protein
MSTTLDTSATPERSAERPGIGTMPRQLVMSMAWDLGPSLAAYYGARALGATEYLALLAGTVASALRLGWVAVRDRRIDPFAMFLMVLFGVGFVLTFVTGDARFMLVKDSLTSLLAGLFFLGSVALRRPLTYYAAQRFSGAAGLAELTANYVADPTFRRRFYVSSLVWGGGLTLESLLRIPMVFLLRIDTAVLASNVLMIAAYSLLISWTVRSTKRAMAAGA